MESRENTIKRSETSKIIKPNISVIMPAFNAESHIREAIDSILNQTLQPLEIIVVNDGSEDQTRHIIGKWSQKEPLLKLITQEHEGIGSARKRGVKHARGNFITFLSADDTWEPTFLEKISDFWKVQSKIKKKIIAYSDWYRCKEDLSVLVDIKCVEGNNNIVTKAPDCIVMFNTVFIPKEVFEKINFDENAKVGEDMIFILETIKDGWEYKLLKEPLSRYRVHKGQRTGHWTEEEFKYHTKNVEKLVKKIRGE